jgi:hypothetical protein
VIWIGFNSPAWAGLMIPGVTGIPTRPAVPDPAGRNACPPSRSSAAVRFFLGKPLHVARADSRLRAFPDIVHDLLLGEFPSSSE